MLKAMFLALAIVPSAFAQALDPCCSAGADGALCPTVSACVCVFDPYCCNNIWDAQCVDEATLVCSLPCEGSTAPEECACDGYQQGSVVGQAMCASGANCAIKTADTCPSDAVECIKPSSGDEISTAESIEFFDYEGNNGAATCSEFCSADWHGVLSSRGWNGACCHIAIDNMGNPMTCDTRKGTGSGGVKCKCRRDFQGWVPQGSPGRECSDEFFDYEGNNGAATCSEFCSADWHGVLSSRGWNGACCHIATDNMGNRMTCDTRKGTGSGGVKCKCRRDFQGWVPQGSPGRECPDHGKLCHQVFSGDDCKGTGTNPIPKGEQWIFNGQQTTSGCGIVDHTWCKTCCEPFREIAIEFALTNLPVHEKENYGKYILLTNQPLPDEPFKILKNLRFVRVQWVDGNPVGDHHLTVDEVIESSQGATELAKVMQKRNKDRVTFFVHGFSVKPDSHISLARFLSDQQDYPEDYVLPILWNTARPILKSLDYYSDRVTMAPKSGEYLAKLYPTFFRNIEYPINWVCHSMGCFVTQFFAAEVTENSGGFGTQIGNLHLVAADLRFDIFNENVAPERPNNCKEPWTAAGNVPDCRSGGGDALANMGNKVRVYFHIGDFAFPFKGARLNVATWPLTRKSLGKWGNLPVGARGPGFDDSKYGDRVEFVDVGDACGVFLGHNYHYNFFMRDYYFSD